VALVLNKKILDVENIREYELIPGRALMIVVPSIQRRETKCGRNSGKSGLKTHVFRSRLLL
jgi:hypothetical protein